MLHIGHLNLICNAKKCCDYLIVGVNTDRLVEEYKNKSTIIPQNERLAIVEAIKYCDEARLANTLDKVLIHSKIHYDIIFIGDDWKNSRRWIETETELRPLGVKVIYLPHTDGTNSTLLREKLLNW